MRASQRVRKVLDRRGRGRATISEIGPCQELIACARNCPVTLRIPLAGREEKSNRARAIVEPGDSPDLSQAWHSVKPKPDPLLGRTMRPQSAAFGARKVACRFLDVGSRVCQLPLRKRKKILGVEAGHADFLTSRAARGGDRRRSLVVRCSGSAPSQCSLHLLPQRTR